MDNIMRMLLTLMLLAAVARPASAQIDHPTPPAARPEPAWGQRPRPAPQPRSRGSQQTDRTSRTFRLGSAGELDLSNISGDIVIARAGGNDATIEIVKTARAGTDEEARHLLQLVQVDVVERGHRVEVRTRYPTGDERRQSNRRNFHVNVAYNVTAPAGTRVRAQSIAGSITAKDIKGETSFESVSGSIRVHNGGRVLSAKSISGDVELLDSETDSTFQASSASGSVTLRRVKARRLDISSISGNLVLEDVDCPRIDAQTVSGNVQFGGVLDTSARFQFRSHSGSVEVAVAGGPGFAVQATSFSGAIRSDFPIQSQAGDTGRGPRTRAVRGVYGDGSAVLELTTFSGSIVLSKR